VTCTNCYCERESGIRTQSGMLEEFLTRVTVPRRACKGCFVQIILSSQQVHGTHRYRVQNGAIIIDFMSLDILTSLGMKKLLKPPSDLTAHPANPFEHGLSATLVMVRPQLRIDRPSR